MLLKKSGNFLEKVMVFQSHRLNYKDIADPLFSFLDLLCKLLRAFAFKRLQKQRFVEWQAVYAQEIWIENKIEAIVFAGLFKSLILSTLTAKQAAEMSA